MPPTAIGRPGFCIVAEIERPPAETLSQIGAFPVAILGDALGHRGIMDAGIVPVDPSFRLCGPAITVATRPGDNLMAHAALRLAQPGDVIVIDARGDPGCAIWGDLMSRAAQARGIAGLIVDGPVRDRNDLVALGWPVYSRGVNPRGPEKDGPGEVNRPISCGGVPVQPGDIIVGDGDGVIVIPPELAEAAIAGAAQRIAAERKIIEAIEGGDTTPFDIDAALRAKGVLGEDETIR